MEDSKSMWETNRAAHVHLFCFPLRGISGSLVFEHHQLQRPHKPIDVTLDSGSLLFLKMFFLSFVGFAAVYPAPLFLIPPCWADTRKWELFFKSLKRDCFDAILHFNRVITKSDCTVLYCSVGELSCNRF